MNITDKIVKEWSWRCSKGYPDINNPEDKKILDQLLQEWGAPKMEAAPAPILEDDGEPEVTFDTLMDLLQSKKDSLPPEFLKKLYTQVQTKGQGLSSKVVEILSQKGIEGIKEVILSTAQRLNVEDKLLKYLQSDNKPGLEALRANSGANLVDFLADQTKLPAALINTVAQQVGSEGGKGVGKAEYALALFMNKGAKKDIGDVDVEGKHIEVKADLARLGERAGNLADLSSALERITDIPAISNLQRYIAEIVTQVQDPAILSKVKEALNREFPGAFKNVDITDTDEVRKGLYTWYVDNFYATEPSDLILLYMGGNYKLYTPEEFKAAVLNGEIKFKNTFTTTNKAPQVSGF